VATEGSSHPLTGPEHALGISAKFARQEIRDWTSMKHEKHWQSICGQMQVGFLNGLTHSLWLCFSLQNEHHPKPAAPHLQHTTNWEQDDRCGN